MNLFFSSSIIPEKKMDRLPNELLEDIILKIGKYHDLSNLARTCKTVHALYTDDIIMKKWFLRNTQGEFQLGGLKIRIKYTNQNGVEYPKIPSKLRIMGGSSDSLCIHPLLGPRIELKVSSLKEAFSNDSLRLYLDSLLIDRVDVRMLCCLFREEHEEFEKIMGWLDDCTPPSEK